MKPDTWHVTPDIWHMVGGENSPKSSALKLLQFWCNDVLKVWRKRVNQLIKELMTKMFVEQPCLLRVRCSWGCSINSLVIDSLIQSVREPFPPDPHNIINHKQYELESWNLKKMFTPHDMSHVTCVSRVMCHMSCVTYNSFFFKFCWTG